ncbi:hypothetical protein BY458DRAFT_321690 [Sporodiniella umbellata]|nr:hypothetical protein BY458DRAFT_321690 [Sporodiniella umbellata]
MRIRELPSSIQKLIDKEVKRRHTENEKIVKKCQALGYRVQEDEICSLMFQAYDQAYDMLRKDQAINTETASHRTYALHRTCNQSIEKVREEELKKEWKESYLKKEPVEIVCTREKLSAKLDVEYQDCTSIQTLGHRQFNSLGSIENTTLILLARWYLRKDPFRSLISRWANISSDWIQDLFILTSCVVIENQSVIIYIKRVLLNRLNEQLGTHYRYIPWKTLALPETTLEKKKVYVVHHWPLQNFDERVVTLKKSVDSIMAQLDQIMFVKVKQEESKARRK